MDVLQHLKYLAPRGYHILHELHAASTKHSTEELAIQLGLPLSLTRKMLRTYKILGPHLKNTDGLSIYTLEIIANAYKKLDNPTPNKLQQLLTAAKTCTTPEEATTVLADIIEASWV